MKEHGWHIIITFISLALLGCIGWVLLTGNDVIQTKDNETTTMQLETRCLNENEKVEYELISNFHLGKKEPDQIMIEILDTETNDLIREFSEDIMAATHYHPVEVHNCGIYFVQSENYDFEEGISLPGYNVKLMKVDADGVKEEVLLLVENEIGGPKNSIRHYRTDFRVDLNEKYLVTSSGYLGKPGYKLIVKDLTTKEDVFVVEHQKLAESPAAQGEIRFMEWTDDNRYLWIRFFVGAKTTGWMQLDSTDWSYELYKSREGILNGYPINLNTGWVPRIPGAFWTGGQMLDEQVKQQRIAEGSTADLYLYNIATGEEILVEETDEPIWRGLEAIWLDDHTLEYRHPSGERKQFVIPTVR